MQGFFIPMRWVPIGLGVLMFCLLSTGQGWGVEYTFEILEFPEATRTNPFGINDAGDVVGIARLGPDPSLGRFSFLFDGTTSVYITIPVPGVVEGINDLGQIVSNSGGVALLSDGTTSLEIVVPGSNVSTTFVRGLNDLSQVVGSFRLGPLFTRFGFLTDGTNYEVLDYPGSVLTEAFGINDAGEVVGFFSVQVGPGQKDIRGFLFDGTVYTEIVFPEGDTTIARGINNFGHIVGTYQPSSPPGLPSTRRGFLFDGTSYQTINVPGSILTDVRGINDAGQVVGEYSDATGVHGFIATPVPESGTGILMGTGLVGLLGYAWRKRKQAA